MLKRVIYMLKNTDLLNPRLREFYLPHQRKWTTIKAATLMNNVPDVYIPAPISPYLMMTVLRGEKTLTLLVTNKLAFEFFKLSARHHTKVESN